MVLIDKPLDNVLKYVFKNLVEEHPLFRLKLLGYEDYTHQAELFYKLAIRYPIRALIADEIGLGKTIETLLLIEWGLRKGIFPNKRVLILVPRSILGQWEKEVRRMGLQPITDIEYFEKYISEVSNGRIVFIFKIDTAKKSGYCEKILKYSWDVIVVDEVHKLGLDTQRLKLVERLVMNNPHASIIFLSATPHKGDDEHYIRLLTLLDPIEKRFIHRIDDFYRIVIDALVFRRSKEQVNKIYEGEKVFVDAELIPEPVEPKSIEIEYIERLDELTRKLLRRCQDDKLRRSIGLLAMTIDKRGLSSPYAGLKTFMKILDSVKQVSITSKLSGKALENLDEYGDEEYISKEGLDIDVVLESTLEEVVRERDVRNIVIEFSDSFKNLINLASEVQNIDSKLSCLKKILLSHLEKGEKVIVFTEFADTANYIYDRLHKELTYNIRKVTGDDLKTVGIEEVKRWLAESSPRVLISTDVASEGLNLQYANVVVNFELPWSLIKLEQRAGRVWRLGQQKDVKIYLMILNHSFEEKIFNALYRRLASSVRAYIIPSTLIALKGREVELPASGIFEFREITPYELWEKYKTSGYEEIDRLIEKYLEKLKELSSKLKNIGLYEVDHPITPITTVIGANKARIEKIVGFTTRNEFNQLLCEVVYKLGKNYCDDFTLNNILKEFIRYSTTSEPLHICCDGVEAPIVLSRVCVNVMGGDISWFNMYYKGSNKQVKDFIKIIERLSNCEEIGRELINKVLGRDMNFLKSVYIEVKSYFKQEVLQKILSNYLRYVEETNVKGIRRGELILKPTNIDEVDVKVYPMVIIVPKAELMKVMESVKEDITTVIKEFITIGDITEEKLEVEAKGREVLEKVLSDRYELTYIGDTKAPFDYIAKDRVTGELIFIELKTLKERKFIIYTENEKEFVDRISDKHKYWLYVVDLTDKQVRSYLNPFTTYKLKLITKEHPIIVNGRKYYVYEEVGKADEVKPI